MTAQAARLERRLAEALTRTIRRALGLNGWIWPWRMRCGYPRREERSRSERW